MRKKYFSLFFLFGLCMPAFFGCQFPISTPTANTSQKEASSLFPEQFVLPSGERIHLRIAHSEAEKIQGLSGVHPEDFEKDEGMLFVYDQVSPQQFWMPDTYFDLDIFFLNEIFEVTAVERNMPKHLGRDEPPLIARTAIHPAQYVLEMRADSELAAQISVGMSMKP